MLEIADVLTADELQGIRAALASAEWVDGRETAGYQAAGVKRNMQLADGSPLADRLGKQVLAALQRSLLFRSAALPDRTSPPLFSRYEGGQDFGTHVDGAYRETAAGRIRTDLSATLFLSDPNTYEGGALMVEDGRAEHRIKLPAGSMILYPSTTLHRVEAVTSGERLASVFWVQSLVPDAGKRAILFDMDLGLQSLKERVGEQDPAIVALTGAYHNLLRMWGAAG